MYDVVSFEPSPYTCQCHGWPTTSAQWPCAHLGKENTENLTKAQRSKRSSRSVTISLRRTCWSKKILCIFISSWDGSMATRQPEDISLGDSSKQLSIQSRLCLCVAPTISFLVTFFPERIGHRFPFGRPVWNRKDCCVGKYMFALTPIQAVDQSALYAHLDFEE